MSSAAPQARPAKPGRVASAPEIELPHATDWRTTDQDEINRRIVRAREESPPIRNLDPRHPIYSNFEVKSGSGETAPKLQRLIGAAEVAPSALIDDVSEALARAGA